MTNAIHPLRREGTSQLARLVRALQPDAFRLDERSLQDLVTASYRYAETLKFYDRNNRHDGNWQPFWEAETLTYLAVVAATDLEDIRRRYEEADSKMTRELQTLTPPGGRLPQAPVIESYRVLLDLLRQQALSLETAYRKLVEINHPLQRLLLRRIERSAIDYEKQEEALRKPKSFTGGKPANKQIDYEELEGTLRKLIALHKGAVLNLDRTLYEPFWEKGKHWGLTNRVDYDAIAAETAISQEGLRALFIAFFDIWQVLKTAAQAGFEAELARMDRPEAEEYRVVQPHIVLFLVFLRLFRYAQDSLNELGAKHLDYYYEQVLGLERHPERPDDAYLLFELAKGVDELILEKGTEFVAGKDKNGRPLIFEALENTMLRQTKVADLKNTYIAENGLIRANPDVKALYDKESTEILPNEKAQRWRAFGDDATLPTATLGFAIASPQLILKEGRRIVDVTIEVTGSIDLKPEYFDLYLSTEKEWLPVAYNNLVTIGGEQAKLDKGGFNMALAGEIGDKTIQIRIVLERDDKPIVALGTELAPKEGFQTKWPMLKVLVKPDIEEKDAAGKVVKTTTAIYEILRQLTITRTTITVDVEDIRENLIIQSDLGVFDGTQKVFPFGPNPEEGNRFFVGSTEAFQKALKKLELTFDWIDAPGNMADYYKEYTAIGRPLGQPSVQMDFIDRADTPAFRQIAGSGTRGVGLTISGRVTNLDGAPVADVTFTVAGITIKDASNNDIRTDGDGKYILTVAANTDINYIPPSVSGISIYEPVPVNTETSSNINVILFPASKVYGEPGSSSVNMVSDIYGKPINGATLVTKEGNLEITADAAKYNLPTPPIPHKDFSKAKAYLKPKEELQLGADSLGEDRLVTGTIKKAGTQGTASGNELQGAQIIAIGTDQTVTAISNTTGAYSLPVPAGASESAIKFYPAAYGDKITGAGLFPSTLQQTIDAFLIEKAQVEQKFTEGNKLKVKISFLDYKNDSISSGIDVSFKNRTDKDFTDLRLVEGFYSISENSIVKFTGSDADQYKDLEIDIGNFNDFTVRMYPKNYYLRSEKRSDNKITIKVFDLDGMPITGFTVAKKSGSGSISVSGTNWTVTGEVTEITISALNFKSRDVQIGSLKDFEVILEPNTASTLTLDASKGVLTTAIIGANNTPATGLTLTVEGTIGGNYIKFETNGNTLNGLKDVEETSISISVKDSIGYYVEKRTAIGAITNLLFTKQIKKSRTAPATTKITVTNFKEDKIEGVIVNNISTLKTDAAGVLSMAITATPLTFTHPAYEPLTFTPELGCTELTIRMIPKPVFFVMEGTVRDMFLATVSGATVQLVRTGTPSIPLAIKNIATAGGAYAIEIPYDLTTAAGHQISVTAPVTALKEVLLDLNAAAPSGKTKSKVDFKLPYSDINYTPLLEGEALKSTFPIKVNALNLVRDTRTQQFERYSPTLKRGFVRMTLLGGNFLHKEYSKVLTLYALAAAGELDLNGDAANPNPPLIPNPPYTPATNGISLSYSSEQVLDKEDQYFHLLPFNGHKLVKVSAEQPTFSPVYLYNSPQNDGNLAYEVTNEKGIKEYPYACGNLYIGLSDLQPGGVLTLLVEVRDGTEGNPEMLPPPVQWSVHIPGNRWQPLNIEQILADDTKGLTRSGLLRLAISTRAAKGSTMLHADYFWLRAAIVEDGTHKAAALPDVVSVRAQAARVRFHNRDNDLAHLAKPLPVGSIVKLAESRSAVKKIEQPMPSFGGQLPETEGLAYYYRVSERLRHRDRAVSVWDYERLLLERFTEIALVKCIPHTRYRHPVGAFASELAPGFVTVAVIPNVYRRAGEDWWEPRFPLADLDDMQHYLAQRSNLFVAFGARDQAHLQVVNALYEKINVTVGVKFKPQEDEDYRTAQLKNEIARFLSPWVDDPAQHPVFGRVLYKSAILQFIETRPYVDFVDMDNKNEKDISEDFVVTVAKTDMAGQPVLDANNKPVVIAIQEAIYPGTARSVFVAGDITVGPPNPNPVAPPVAGTPSADLPATALAMTIEEDTGQAASEAETTMKTTSIVWGRDLLEAEKAKTKRGKKGK